MAIVVGDGGVTSTVGWAVNALDAFVRVAGGMGEEKGAGVGSEMNCG